MPCRSQIVPGSKRYVFFKNKSTYFYGWYILCYVLAPCGNRKIEGVKFFVMVIFLFVYNIEETLHFEQNKRMVSIW